MLAKAVFIWLKKYSKSNIYIFLQVSILIYLK